MARAALTISSTLVWMSASVRVKAGWTISTLLAPFSSNSRFFITPGRTVAMAGRKRGQTMVAIRWPPKAGRVIFRLVLTSKSFVSKFMLSTSREDPVRRKLI